MLKKQTKRKCLWRDNDDRPCDHDATKGSNFCKEHSPAEANSTWITKRRRARKAAKKKNR